MAPTRRRLFFIDMYRGLAVLVMIEGHIFNSTVRLDLRPTKEFHYFDLLHGMVAPSFIFMSGFAFTLGLQRKWDSFLKFDQTFWIQIRRLLFVLGLAYWLHLPAWSFQTMLHASRETILYFLRCDVLQLIALSLLFSLFLCVTIRNQKTVMMTLFGFVLAIVFTTPFIYFVDTRKYLPVPFSDYLNASYGALFPLFPFAAYSFAGTLLCWIYLKTVEAQKEAILFRILAAVGLIFFISAFVLFYAPWQYYAYVDPARSSPRHFMMKIGLVFMVLSALWYYERKRQPERSILSIAGQESLLVYGLHLVIVYGSSFMPFNIASAVGHVLSFVPALVITYTLVAAMILVALWWHRMKQKQARLAKAVFYTLCAIYFIKFFVS
jgi:uncharacterized membrane protein